MGTELRGRFASLDTLMVPTSKELSLTSPESIDAALNTWQPDVIVNAAAYTAVDRAESESELAQTINGLAPGWLAAAADKLGASLIHISTDYVFDGQKGLPYVEEDRTNPLGSYGRSKCLGEEAVRSHCERHIILRTAWVYGTQGKGNFVKTILRLGSEREEVRVVYDQVGSPTWAHDIAAAIAGLVPRLGPEVYGTYHYTNSGVASWYDFAVAIFEEAAALDIPLRVQQVTPITTDQYPLPAPRPAYSVLSCEKIAGVLEAKPPHWRQSLRKMLAELYA